MSFQEVLGKGAGRPRQIDPFCVSINARHLMISIAHGTVKDLGWKPRSRISVLRGTDKDSGKLRLCPGPSGYILQVVNLHRRLRITLPPWRGLPLRGNSMAAEWHIIERNSDGVALVELTLPEWQARLGIAI
jgi:hypothetical protein